MRNDLEWHAAFEGERALLHLWRETGSKYRDAHDACGCRHIYNIIMCVLGAWAITHT